MAEINLSRIKLSQLRALVAIANSGTFSDAALQLELSQSAVSHAIATLESELGVILLNRGRQGAVLTPIGQEITREAQKVLDSLDTISYKAQLARGLGAGQVRVAGFRSVATHILPAVIEQFRSQYPGIGVSITEFIHYHLVEEALRQGRADIGFTALPTANDFDAWELIHDQYVVLLPPGESTQHLSWQDLHRHALIQTPTGEGCRHNIEGYFAHHHQPLKPAYEVREDSTIVSMVRSGLGASIMAKLAAEPIPQEVGIAQLPEPLERVIGVIVMAEGLHAPPVYAFLETIKAVWQEK